MQRDHRGTGAALLTAALLVVPPDTSLGVRSPAPPAAPTPAPCRDDRVYAELDFWIGRWDVLGSRGEKEGENAIEKILDGCAILENWTDAEAGHGKSLFFYRRADRCWKQVWVTDFGAVKEKVQVLDYQGPGIRFQGEIPLFSGGTILDRTTLCALPDGRVRQLIEQSRDGGKTWSSWEGIYVRSKKSAR